MNIILACTTYLRNSLENIALWFSKTFWLKKLKLLQVNYITWYGIHVMAKNLIYKKYNNTQKRCMVLQANRIKKLFSEDDRS